MLKIYITNILFVVPHNRLSQEIEGDATTYNMFFRIPVHKGDELPEFHHSNLMSSSLMKSI